MSQNQLTSDKSPQFPLFYFFVFTTAVAIVIALQAATAISASRETYSEFLANMSPPLGLMFSLDAISKGLAICGILHFGKYRYTTIGDAFRPDEFLWPLLGLVVSLKLISGFWLYAPVGFAHILGGGIGLVCSRPIAWKLVYFLFAITPFLPLASHAILNATVATAPYFLTQIIPCLNELTMTGLVIVDAIGTRPTFIAWGGMFSQAARTCTLIVFILFKGLGML